MGNRDKSVPAAIALVGIVGRCLFARATNDIDLIKSTYRHIAHIASGRPFSILFERLPFEAKER